jgi:hypothetical protein
MSEFSPGLVYSLAKVGVELPAVTIAHISCAHVLITSNCRHSVHIFIPDEKLNKPLLTFKYGHQTMTDGKYSSTSHRVNERKNIISCVETINMSYRLSFHVQPFSRYREHRFMILAPPVDRNV